MKTFDILKNSAVWGENQVDIYNSNLAFCYSANIKGRVRLNLTCSCIYRLTVNGKFIGYGPARTAHGYSKVDSYSIDLDGDVVIVVETVNYNVNSYYLIMQDAYFTASLEKDDKTIATSEDFICYDLTDRIKKVQRFSFQRPFMEAYAFSGEREKLYRGEKSVFPIISTVKVPCPILKERGLPLPKLNSLSATCIEVGKSKVNDARPVWTDRSITDISDILLGFKYSELVFYASDICSKFEFTKTATCSSDSVSISSNEYAVFDFSRNVSGFFSLKIKAKADTEIYLTFDEIDLKNNEHCNTDGVNVCFYRNNCCNVIYFNVKKGEYTLTAIEANTARFARVLSVGGDIECSLDMVLYQNDDMYKLKFNCADEKLNAIVKAAQNSLAQNSVDCLIDCPSRERAGWYNDSWFTVEGEKILSGNLLANHALLENVLLAPDLKGLPKGVFPMCYPSDHLDGNYCPTLICWTILDVIKHVKYTGDEQFFERFKPKMQLALDYLARFENEFGLLENLEGWVFIEWSKANDYIDGVHFPTNMLYYGTLYEYAIKTGDKALLDKAEKIKKTIIDLSFNGEFFEDHLVRKDGVAVKVNHVSEICQYFAFLFNIADRLTFNKLYDTIVNDLGVFRKPNVYPNVVPANLITGIYAREEVLFRAGEHALMLDEIKEIYYPMAVEFGTLCEGFEKGMEFSDNHGLTSCVANWIACAVSGFKSDRLGEYEFVPTKVDIKGEIEFPVLDKVVKYKK